jgi:riboflavin kinase/FMN adenylyltransferase
MRIIEDAWNQGELPRGLVLTIGNFDALHRGHQALLSRVAERARAVGAPSGLITFEPHPANVLHSESNLRRLTTRDQRARLVAAMGIEVMLIVRFTSEFSRVGAEAFVRRLLVERLGIREVHVGEHFSFGHDRQGDLQLLRRLGIELGFVAAGMPELRNGGELISSSRIRAAILAGDVGKGRSMLGRPYAVEGDVVRGSGRGAELGWPTANLDVVNELIPRTGVYVGEARFGGDQKYAAAVNVGTRPTVEERGAATVVEAHLLEFDRRCYGERLELAFLERLREEHRFQGIGELREQIARDVRATREYFPVRVR